MTIRRHVSPSTTRLCLEPLEDRLVPANLLFFGNSYTDAGLATTRIDLLVKAIAEAAGQASPYTAERAPGGETLAGHAAAMSPGEVQAMLPVGQGVDVAIFQGQSLEAASQAVGAAAVQSFRQGAVNLAQSIFAVSPNARVVLYETWSREPPDPNPDVFPTPYAGPANMQADILQGYLGALQDLQATYGVPKADMAPAGEAWGLQGWPDANYRHDEGNGGHPTPRGALLAALTLYTVIYDDNVSDIPIDRASALLLARGLTGTDWLQCTATADRALGNQRQVQNTRFVQQVFLDILGRPADSGAQNFFVGQLITGGMNRTQVSQSLMFNDENRTNFIVSHFQSILGRGADLGGFSVFMSQMRAGVPQDTIRAELFGSNEFLARAGGTYDWYVRALYDRVLHRTASGVNVTYWVGRLNSGLRLFDVAISFIYGRENRHRQVRDLFQGLLRRPADAASENAFVEAMLVGVRFEDVATTLTASAEYYRRFL